MDLQHPSITRTLKEGYPDGTGKPQQTITVNPNFNRVKEDNQMEKLLQELMIMCWENELNFEISIEGKLVEVRDSSTGKVLGVSRGYIKDWDWEEPEDSLKRMIEEVTVYIKEVDNE